MTQRFFDWHHAQMTTLLLLWENLEILNFCRFCCNFHQNRSFLCCWIDSLPSFYPWIIIFKYKMTAAIFHVHKYRGIWKIYKFQFFAHFVTIFIQIVLFVLLSWFPTSILPRIHSFWNKMTTPIFNEYCGKIFIIFNFLPSLSQFYPKSAFLCCWVDSWPPFYPWILSFWHKMTTPIFNLNTVGIFFFNSNFFANFVAISIKIAFLSCWIDSQPLFYPWMFSFDMKLPHCTHL